MWRQWLLRAVAGDPADVQIMYGIAGERRLDERELDWLPGLRGLAARSASETPPRRSSSSTSTARCSTPSTRRASTARRPTTTSGRSTRKLLDWLEEGWRHEDAGIWEVRGPTRHFTHSKVMAWVAFDRAVARTRSSDARARSTAGDRLRDEIHAEVLGRAWSESKQAFAQSYGSDELDASILLMPIVGFLPATDERFVSTVEAIRRELTVDGLVLRYRPARRRRRRAPAGEGVFLPCSFWLADVLALQGSTTRHASCSSACSTCATTSACSPRSTTRAAGRQLGNFPQAFTHLALVNTALVLGEGRSLRQ